jgi:signal transduction histidine kinase/CheY-like chemotaxis protein
VSGEVQISNNTLVRLNTWFTNLPWGGTAVNDAKEMTRRRLILGWGIIVAYETVLVTWIITTGRFNQLSSIPLSTQGLLLYVSIFLGIGGMVALRFFSTRVVGQLLEARAEALSLARDASEQATQAKSAFLANMSHEIRTPLNAVIGMSNILADSKLTPTQAQQIEIIHTSGSHLLTLINDILDFSKIEAGKLKLEKIPMSLRRCVEESLDLCAGKAFEKNLSLTYEMGDDVPEGIIGDIGRLRQVIVNLANNAVKFTHKGGVKVTLKAAPIEGTACNITIAVEDTGIGIEAETQKKLFTAFQQADASTTREFGGTGLGLAITRMLAEQMGGTVGLESMVGKGSIFSITFPTSEVKIREVVPWLGGAMELKGKVALVVDDHIANVEMLRHHLEKWGMTAFATTDPMEANKLMKGKKPDIAIIDQIMPGLKGTELAHLFGKSKPKMPIVIATSDAGIEDEGPNVVAIIQKPIKPSDLFDSIVGALMESGHAPKMQAKETGFNSQLAIKHPLRILIAEDAIHNQMVALASLEKFGYKADLAQDGQIAVNMCEQKTYDLVFMDLQMPNMDGYEATSHITSRTIHPRIVGLSAHVGAEERERCAAVGMASYLSKPFAVMDLRRALVETTALHGAPAPEKVVIAPIKFNGVKKSATTVKGNGRNNGKSNGKSVARSSSTGPKTDQNDATCAANTAAGNPCSRNHRLGSKYCSSHKGYRPKKAELVKA